ncbi:hypothetical protein FPZ49_10695 [Paenibacillus cremeus]|uniref:Uncharacterized protein n=2 Tax=Paenibacillus cremeus TaxID=2163881 RepID=A0A559KCI6_9BACL|nr:hypothetical protein FPZ49_10695 [Paenibacillus cremeus]
MKKLQVTEHAVKRAKERFNRRDRNDVLNFCKAHLGAAQYIGKTTSDNGEGLMFSRHGVMIVLSEDLSKVITLMEIENRSHIARTEPNTPLYKKLKSLYETEIRKLERSEKSCNKKVDYIKAELNVELSQLNLKLLKTRSESIRCACKARINAIETYIKDKESELCNIQSEKKKIIKALACIV